MAATSVTHVSDRERTAGGIAARALDALDEVRREDWDRLVPAGSGPLKHGYLRAWENVELRGLRSRPVVAHVSGSAEPVAACPGYFYDLDVPAAGNPKTAPAVRAIRRLLPEFLFARTYELGSPTPLTNPFLVPDDELRHDAVEALVEAALEEGRHAGAEMVLVQNFTSEHAPAGEILAEHGFASVPMLATAVLDLPYDSFDDYLGAMRSQYRRRARQTLKRSGELEPRLLHRFHEQADELARLWRLVYERASEVKREILTPEFFRAASEQEDLSVLVLCRPDGSIASFAMLLDDRPWLSFLQCGFEEGAGRTEGAYFRLLYEIVRSGIDGGFEQIDLGVTTLAPKLDVGAVPVPLYAWLKHRNRLFQRIMPAFGHGAMRPPEVEPRKVFKEPPPAVEEIVRRRGLSV